MWYWCGLAWVFQNDSQVLKQLPSKRSLHFLMPGCSSFIVRLMLLGRQFLAKHNSGEWASHGEMEGLTLEVPNTQSMVHLDVPIYLVILTDCSVHWTPLLSPSPRVLIFIQSSELVHPGFSGRAKISRGKYVKRLLLVDGESVLRADS